MQLSKSKFWKRLAFFVLLQAMFLSSSLYVWGFLGQIGPKKFRYLIDYSTKSQKEKLSEALNFYYNKGIAKYTSGLLLRCDPETKSMIDQFMWFHRNTFSYIVFENASYHEVLISTLNYFDLDQGIDVEKVSTYYLERKLINWQYDQEENSLTGKDKNSLLLTLLDTGGTFVLGSTPAGWSISALNLLHKSSSDPAKAVPAIVVFKEQRETNFLWTAFAATLLNLFICFLVFRKK